MKNTLLLQLIVIVSTLIVPHQETNAADSVNRFAGVELTVGVMDAPAIGGPASIHAQTWQERFGGNINVIKYPFGQLFEKLMAGISGPEPEFDVIFYAPAWAGDFFSKLTPLPDELRNSESFDDIHPTYRDRLMKWDGQWIAVTVDGDLFNGYYRKDLFADEKNRIASQKKYGYRLNAPNIWKEYQGIAEFFAGRIDLNGNVLYGSAEPFARGGQQFWDLFSRAAAYTNSPGNVGGQFFDPNTMTPQINNPGWLRAVNDYKEILKFSAPEAKEFDIIAARKLFVEKEQAVMALDWGDIGQLAEDVKHSRIAGKVGYFILPGSSEAWDYITWYSSPENSMRDVVTSGSGINPYRFSHFINIDAWTKVFSRSAAADYLAVLQKSLDSPNVSLDLRLPGFFQYTEALEIELTKILNDTMTVKDGMDRVAARWQVITDKYGRDKQLAIYRSSMGLSSELSKNQKSETSHLPAGREEKSRYVIGFSQATITESWRLLFNNQLREEAVKYPEIELIVVDGQDSVEKQNADMETFIEQKVDAILVSPKVVEGLTPVVNKAFSAQIPVFVLDRDLTNDNYTQYIGGDNREIGRAAGRYAVDYLGGAKRAKDVGREKEMAFFRG